MCLFNLSNVDGNTMDGWYVHVFQLVFKKGVIWGNLEGLAWLFYYSFSIFQGLMNSQLL